MSSLYLSLLFLLFIVYLCFFFSSRRRHTRCALVTGVQTCALPIFIGLQTPDEGEIHVFGESMIGRLDDEALAIRKRWGVLFQGGEIGRASCRERVCQYV